MFFCDEDDELKSDPMNGSGMEAFSRVGRVL